MLAAFLQETFRRLAGGMEGMPPVEPGKMQHCVDTRRAVEHVVDETYHRIRLVPGYRKRLSGPVERVFLYIDRLVEQLPEPIHCSRTAYVSDPRVNAFFAGPTQIQEIFSTSQEVRELFDSDPDADQCWGLMCMRKEERSQFGMELVGDEVRKEVLQTGVSFTDHQIASPGSSEAEARQALKCCIFNSLLAYVRRRGHTIKESAVDLENRRRVLAGRLRTEAGNGSSQRRNELDRELAEVEQRLADQDEHLDTIEQRLDFVVRVLNEPEQYVRGQSHYMHLSRLGVKLEDDSEEAGYGLDLSEIRVACHQPRIATLVRFPRSELLPQQDYLQKADLFLAV